MGPVQQSIRFFQLRKWWFIVLGVFDALSALPVFYFTKLLGVVGFICTVPFTVAVYLFLSFVVILEAFQVKDGYGFSGVIKSIRESVRILPKALAGILLGLLFLCVPALPAGAMLILSDFGKAPLHAQDDSAGVIFVLLLFYSVASFFAYVAFGLSFAAGAVRAREAVSFRVARQRCFSHFFRKAKDVFLISRMWFGIVGGTALLPIGLVSGGLAWLIFGESSVQAVQVAVLFPIASALSLGGLSYFAFSENENPHALH